MVSRHGGQTDSSLGKVILRQRAELLEHDTARLPPSKESV